MLSACLRLSTSASKFSFLVFLKVLGVALVKISFSIMKDENLAKQISTKYVMSMYLGMSAASFSESDSDRFRFFPLFEDAIEAVYFSLTLYSTTHHGIQLVLGMNQVVGEFFCFGWDGNTRSLYSSWGEVFDPLPISGFQHWSNSYSHNAINPHPLPSST